MPFCRKSWVVLSDTVYVTGVRMLKKRAVMTPYGANDEGNEKMPQFDQYDFEIIQINPGS